MSLHDVKWYVESPETVLDKLGSGHQGLSRQEARERLKRYGFNVTPVSRKYSIWRRIANQFHNILIYILLIASVITAALQHWIDTGVILGAVLLNALVGFIQEGKAEKAIESLKQLLSLQANVMREGKKLLISADQLVPGDLVVLHSGDKVPADLRLINVKNCQIQEAALTGESLPVAKSECSVSETASLAERYSMAYAGTFVVYGSALGVVTATGSHTEIGRVTAMLAGVPSMTTPLLKQMAEFSRWLAVAILFFSAAIFLFGIIIRHYPVEQMFIASVAIAVSAIPEGLPAIMTIILAVGAVRMAKHHAVIRRLPAVETLSSVTVICTDKTGTLTKNELTVQFIQTHENSYSVSGSGYQPDGHILLHHKACDLQSHPDLELLLRASVFCNDASLRQENGTWILNGNPVDGALLALGLKAGIDYQAALNTHHKIDFIPFESAHKFMASLHHDHQGNAAIYVKGAPEKIVDMCGSQYSHQHQVPFDRAVWLEHINYLAKNGMRVLALAYKPLSSEKTSLHFNDVESGLVFLGLVGIIDPPREEARNAVLQCQKAGICVKMITGDHAETANAIARQVGIESGHVLTGAAMDLMDDKALSLAVNDINIYARTTPEHKLRLINALRDHHHVIAMTGDGVNDAPALRHADIGIAMGMKGTDVAKEAAEIVLADDDFSTIAEAVKEGRTVYDNLKKIILFILPNDAGEGFSVFFAILLGYTLPITPAQILWVNLVTAVTLGLALGFELPEKDIMLRKPRSIHEALLSRFLLWRIGYVSLLFVCGMFGLFMLEMRYGADIATARTAVVNLLVLTEALYLINCRKIYASVLTLDGLFGSVPVLISIAIVLVLQAGLTYLSFMQAVFDTRSLGLHQWGLIMSIAVMIFLLIELEKAALRIFRWSDAALR